MAGVAIAAAVGAVVGGAAAAIQSGGDFNAIWKGALVGAVGGAVGGWAAPALGFASGVGYGVVAGGIGGLTSGILGTALNGGTGEDYLKNGLFGGIGGAAIGGLSAGIGGMGANGELGAAGGEVGINPVTGEAVPTGSPEINALPSGDIASGYGGGNVSGSEAINTSVTGAQPAQTPAYTTPQLDAGTQPLQFASNQTMTDVPIGSSPIPQELPGSYQAPSLGESAFGSGGTTPSGNTDFSGVNFGEGQLPTDYSNFATPKATGTDYSNMTDAYGNKYSDLYGDKFQKAMEAGASGKSYDPNNYVGDHALNWGEKLNYNFGGLMDTAKTMGKGALIGQTLKGAGALLGQNEARQNQRQLMDLYNQQSAYTQQLQNQNQQAFGQNLAAYTQNQQAFRDQLAAARGYNARLEGSYDDPNAYLNSPEAQASRSLAMQKLLAQNAMAGRRSSGLALQNQLISNQLSNLNAYRTGLRQNIQYPNQLGSMGYQNTGADVNARILGQAQAQSPTGNLMAGLGSMFTPAANYYLMTA